MSSSLSTLFSVRVLSACVWVLGCAVSLEAAAQSPSTLPPQVMTRDPALLSPPPAEAEEDDSVTITAEDRSTSIRTYGSGGRATREVVNPPILPEYSESPPAEPQSVMPDSDPVRGDMVQPPMWTLWSW
jgi:hypothetical protein